MNTTPITHAGDDYPRLPSRPDPGRRWRIGWIVALSLATGLMVGLLLAAAPFVPASESELTGALLCGFALGWAMLAVLSVRYSDQPQRWAAAPAVFMGVGGLLLLTFGSSVHGVLNWIWPPTLLTLAVWMIGRCRRQLQSRGGRWLLYPVLATLVLISVGAGYETIREATEEAAYPMPGELIDVGGRSLHLHCTGSGTPTVVLQTGGGEMSSTFGWIAPAVAADTRVCVYDRAGRGWSDLADAPQDAALIASDLHTMLERGQVPGPYVLAGHSFGGLYVLAYAAQYPDDVAGMVLVDTTLPSAAATTAVASSSDVDSYNLVGRVSALLSSSARFGLGRLISQVDYGSLPPRSRDEQRASAATASHVQSTIEEYAMAGASASQAASVVSLGDRPLVVLTAEIGSSANWIAAHGDLATLSSNSSQRLIEGASHSALVHDERGAAATTQAILEVVTSARTGGRLG